jgi:hypothetical protein
MPSTIDSIRIEKLILADHKRRIVEEQVKDLRDLLAIK